MRTAPRYICVQGCRVCSTFWGAGNRRWGDSDRWTCGEGFGPGSIYRYNSIVVICVFVITLFLMSSFLSPQSHDGVLARGDHRSSRGILFL